MLANEPRDADRTKATLRKAIVIARTIGIKILQILIGLAVWHLIVLALDVDPRIVPLPGDVLRSLWAQMSSGFIFSAVWLTLQETAIGFFIGSALGILLGVVLVESKLLRNCLEPYLIALQSVPKVAVTPLFLIWFGFGVESKIALVISIIFFPVLVNTMAGLAAVTDDQLELMRAYRASRLQILLRVKAYVALPYVFAALEVSVVLAMTAAVVAEMLGSGTTIGLGTMIRLYESRLNAAGIFANLIALSLLGVLLHALVAGARKRLLSW